MDPTLTNRPECDGVGSDLPAGDDGYFSPPAPGVRLHFYGGSFDKDCRTLRACGEYLFGRSRESDFRFSDANRIDVNVSRKHAILRVDNAAVTLVNQTPRNGLILNGVTLADYQEVVLRDTDVVTLGCNGPNIRVRIGDLAALRSGERRPGEENA